MEYALNAVMKYTLLNGDELYAVHAADAASAVAVAQRRAKPSRQKRGPYQGP
jgi:hypothetical protein